MYSMTNFTKGSKTLREINAYSEEFAQKKSVIDEVVDTFGISKERIIYDETANTVSFRDSANMPYTAELTANTVNMIHKDVLDLLVDNTASIAYKPKYNQDELKDVIDYIKSFYYPENKVVSYNSSKKLITFIGDDGMSYSADLSEIEVFEYSGTVYVPKTAEIKVIPKYTMDDLKSVFAEIMKTFHIVKADICFDHGEISFSASADNEYTAMDYYVDLSNCEVFIYADNPYVPKDTKLIYVPKYTMDDLIPLQDYISGKYPGMSRYCIEKEHNMLTFEYNNSLYTLPYVNSYVYKINDILYVSKADTLDIDCDVYKSAKAYYADKYLISKDDIQYADNIIRFTGINGVSYAVDFSEDTTIEFPSFPNDIYVKSQYSDFATPNKTNIIPKDYYRTVKQIQQLTGLSMDKDITIDERYYISVLGKLIPFEAGIVYSKYDTLYTTAEDFQNGLKSAFPVNVKEYLESLGFAAMRNNSGTANYEPIGYNAGTKKITLFGIDLNIDNAISLGEYGNRNTDSNINAVLVNMFGKAFNGNYVDAQNIKGYICAKYNFNASECNVTGNIVTFKGYSFSIENARVSMGGLYFISKAFIESNVDDILRKVIGEDKQIKLFSAILDASEDLSSELYYDEETSVLHVGVSTISDENLIFDPDIHETDYTSRTDFVKAAAHIPEEMIPQIVEENKKVATTVITVPIDSRPVSYQNFKLLTEIGGDECVVITEGLDGGLPIQATPTERQYTLFNHGNSGDTRLSLKDTISDIQGNKTIIINTASCFTNGLIGSRMPTSYYADNTEAENDTHFRYANETNEFIDSWIEYLNDLRNIIKEQNSSSRIYVHCVIPRTQPGEYLGNCDQARPDPDGGTWGANGWNFNTDNKGLSYFHTSNESEKTSCMDILREWSYLESKYLSTKQPDGSHGLEDYEWDCLTHYNNMYRFDDSPYKTNILNAFNNLFVNAEYFLIQLMKSVASGIIDELIIGVDDIEFPAFYHGNSLFDKNSVKYSFANTCLENIKEYHRTHMLSNPDRINDGIVFTDNINDSLECCAEHINYLLGTDETPQLIYARDLTRRMHRTPKYLNYSLPNTGEMGSVGEYDIDTISDVLRKTQNFITNTSYYHYDDPNEYSKPRNYLNDAVYEVGEMHTFVRCNKKIKDGGDAVTAAKSIYNAFNDPYNDSTTSSPRRFNNGNINMCLLDSALEDPDVENSCDWYEHDAGADWLLLHTLKDVYKGSLNDPMYSQNSVSQLSAYSAWNTVGNSLGLGLAHAQVFAIMDSTYDDMTDEKAKTIVTAHIKLLATHMLEDALYNRMKGNKLKMFSNIYTSDDTLIKDQNMILTTLTGDYDEKVEDNTFNLYGGHEWVIKRFTDPDIIHRFNNYSYTIENFDVIQANLPWKRKFECLLTLTAEVNIFKT